MDPPNLVESKCHLLMDRNGQLQSGRKRSSSANATCSCCTPINPLTGSRRRPLSTSTASVCLIFIQTCFANNAFCQAFQVSWQRNPRPFLPAIAASQSPFFFDRDDRILEYESNQQSTAVKDVYHSSYSSARTFAGLSKFHQSILSRTQTRQRFITGKYPLTINIVHNNPTRSWLKQGQGTELLVNNTAPSKSLASFDRLLWLDEDERVELKRDYNMVSMELIAEVYCERPAYVQTIIKQQRMNSNKHSLLPTRYAPSAGHSAESTGTDTAETLYVTGFSLTGRKGILKSIDCETGNMESVNTRTERILQWPNEVVAVPEQLILNVNVTSTVQQRQKLHYQDALLVCDGFLVPGKDRGGLRVVKYPGDPHREWTVSLTPATHHRWFYHQAVWIDLTGDGRLSLLAARCQVSVASRENGGVTSGISKKGQLVWLECPKPHSFDPTTNTPLEIDGTVYDPFSARHTPWTTRVLADGPDVMFCVADLDPSDDTIEVFSSQFFGKCVGLHSIRKGLKPRVTFDRIIDDQCGSAFGSILADLDGLSGLTKSAAPTAALVIDAGTTVGTTMAGDVFSHLLVTSHECTYAEADRPRSVTQLTDSDEGGSLFAYRVPEGIDAWKAEPWARTVVASGFKVNGQLSNMINPGAPGLVYTFHARRQDKLLGKRPLIAVAGDCAEAAYIFRPDEIDRLQLAGEDSPPDASTHYQLMVEIKCESTVGSIGVGYDDFTTDMPQEADYAKLYIPCHEKDKILVFALGSSEEDMDDGW
ncbi:hypothetical protein MPSEU_001093200 [Mayamaea pseudoterrestris]|nr:hypothetical protein MPSEU_001093200 [Mayamaea pseudoterrestris]